MNKLFANSEDLDQTPHSAVSDLGLHCLPITCLGVSGLQWANLLLISNKYFASMQPGLYMHLFLHSMQLWGIFRQ